MIIMKNKKLLKYQLKSIIKKIIKYYFYYHYILIKKLEH